MTNKLTIEHTTFALMGPLVHTQTSAMPCHCVIFQIGDRVILLDTGFGLREMSQPNLLLGDDALFKLGIVIDRRLTAYERLKSRGILPEQVTDIIVTHLDNDHAGGLHDFPNATVHLSAEELESFDGTRLRGPYKPYQLSHHTKFKTYAPTDEKWFGLNVRSLELPAVLDAKLVPLPGHTLGHCGVAYREDGKWSLHAGDAYFDSRVHFMEPTPSLPLEIAFQADRDARVSSLKKLQILKQTRSSEVAMYCTHDQREFRSWTQGRDAPDLVSEQILAASQ